MATTHVFIVDHTTLKFHLEYQFVGTGAAEKIIDFNNGETTAEYAGRKSKGEDGLVGMIADSQRLRDGDSVIFYLLQSTSNGGVSGGKFYGIFKVKEAPSFLDHNDKNQYLALDLNKSLTFRALIEPDVVYPSGVSEWEALDEIRNLHSPNQMIWSLIYRKLKANRGNTMITIYESERLTKLIRDKNHLQPLTSKYYSFDRETEEIVPREQGTIYAGRKEKINILPRLVRKYQDRLQFEPHLQAYLVQNIERVGLFDNDKIEWIGNEVSCGVGMQRIDILLSVIRDGNRVCIPIELKSTVASQGIHNQLQRYVDWIDQYYNPNRPSDIEPMIISRAINDKESQFYSDLIGEFKNFNARNNTLKLRYIEFSIDANNKTVNFKEISY